MALNLNPCGVLRAAFVLTFVAPALLAQDVEVFPTKRTGSAGGPPSRAGSSLTQDSRPRTTGLLERLQNVQPKRPEAQPAATRDALDRIVDRLGGIESWYALGDIAIERDVTALDARGQALFEHRFVHRSRTGFGPARDTIEWSNALQFGRQGGRAWARSGGGIERPDLEARAMDETARWTTLLHFPFSLRDRQKYAVEGEKDVLLHGRKLQRVRVVVPGPTLQVGPTAPTEAVRQERWDLFVDPNSGLPIVAEHYRPGVGTRRILLGQWRRVGGDGLRLPFERTILGEDGESPRLLIRLRLR